MKYLIAVCFCLSLCGTFSYSEYKYIGTIYSNENDQAYQPKSASNPYGTYGSQYGQESVNNKNGTYGSEYSPKSAQNQYATDAPVLVDEDGNYRGKLSKNQYDPDSTSNPYGKYGSKYSPDSINNQYAPKKNVNIYGDDK